jgi:hypothetical protein
MYHLFRDYHWKRFLRFLMSHLILDSLKYRWSHLKTSPMYHSSHVIHWKRFRKYPRFRLTPCFPKYLKSRECPMTPKSHDSHLSHSFLKYRYSLMSHATRAYPDCSYPTFQK